MKNSERIACASCEDGQYEEVVTRYEAKAADGIPVVLPKAKILRCSKCMDELLPPETQEQIDRALAEQTEQMSQRELEGIAERFGLDQTELSEALGLGNKTFHRWLKGTQYPSRSMGYYLRVLAEFPEAFEWLRERAWRKRNRIAHFQQVDLAVQFRDLQWLQAETPCLLREETLGTTEQEHCRFNPASLFQQTKIK